jgi:hypothetical protein
MRNPNPWITASSPLIAGAIALLMCTTVSFAAHPMGAFYSDEVYTSRNVGGGYEAGDSVYFLVEYGLYRKPQGIARFPDGGIARYLYHEVFLCRAKREDSSVRVLMPVLPGGTPGLDVKSSGFETDGDTLMVLLKSGHGGRDEPEGWTAVGWDMRAHSAEPVSEPEKIQLLERLTYDGDGRVRITETTALLERATLRSLGLPSPLDHMSRSDRQFQNDLVELRGDEYYRRAIIEAIADRDIRAEPEDILRRIDEKRRALEDPYRGLYEMRAIDVIDSLRDLSE